MSECAHGTVTRIRALYVDGRPLYRCDHCGAQLTYEDDEQSYKAFAPIKGASRG